MTINSITWYEEDGLWYGWDNHHNPRTDFHQFEIRHIDGIWAGFIIDEGTATCVTYDHDSAAFAKNDLSDYLHRFATDERFAWDRTDVTITERHMS